MENDRLEIKLENKINSGYKNRKKVNLGIEEKPKLKNPKETFLEPHNNSLFTIKT